MESNYESCCSRSCRNPITKINAFVDITANVSGLIKLIREEKTIISWRIVSRNTGDARFHRECFDSIKKEFEKWQISTSDPKRAKTTSSDTAFSKNTSSESPDADTNGRRYSRRIKSKQQKVQSEVGSVKGFLATGGIDPIAFQRERNAFLQSLETAEFTDSMGSVENDGKKVAALIRDANENGRSICFFTGAGISTNAGISDYRGRKGKWTEEDTGIVIEEKEGVSYEDMRPTYTHEAISKLVNDGQAQFVISQNCDGLHLLSGVPMHAIAELHGNVFLEVCSICCTKYLRPYYTLDDEIQSLMSAFVANTPNPNPDAVISGCWTADAVIERGTIPEGSHIEICKNCGINHFTGRKCSAKTACSEKCCGKLKDTIINFGDLLDEDNIDRSGRASNECALMLSLGSSMTVTPASDFVENAERLVIVNKQKTGFSAKAKKTARVFADSDVFMGILMKNLYCQESLNQWERSIQEKLPKYNKLRGIKGKATIIPPSSS
eukprot:gene5917-7310_t